VYSVQLITRCDNVPRHYCQAKPSIRIDGSAASLRGIQATKLVMWLVNKSSVVSIQFSSCRVAWLIALMYINKNTYSHDGSHDVRSGFLQFKFVSMLLFALSWPFTFCCRLCLPRSPQFYQVSSSCRLLGLHYAEVVQFLFRALRGPLTMGVYPGGGDLGPQYFGGRGLTIRGPPQ